MSDWQARDPAWTLQLHRQGRRAYAVFGWVLLLFLLAQVAFPLVLAAVLDRIAPWTALNLNLSLLITYGSMYGVGFPLVWLILDTVPDRRPSRPLEAEERLGPLDLLGLFSMLTLLSSAALLLMSLLLALLGYEVQAPLEGLREGGANPWLLGFLAIVVAPVMEELVFRWLPYRKLSGYGMRSYVLWTSLAFGLFHIHLLQGVYAGVMGLVFAIVTYRTGRVWGSILLHFLVNLNSSLGLGGVLLAEEWGFLVYGATHLLLCLGGVAVLLHCLRSGFFRLREGEGGLETWRNAFLSVGYVCFVALCVGMMVLIA